MKLSKLSRQTKIWVGTVIVLALILQVVTYVKYNKLESQVAGYHNALATAQDETDASNAYELFHAQTTPVLKAQEADAGWKWGYLVGRGWVWGRGSKPVTPSPTNNNDCSVYGSSQIGCSSSATPGTGASGTGGANSIYEECYRAGINPLECARLYRNSQE